MADNYLERRMEAYRAQPAAQPRRAATLERLLTRNRSVRGYDARFVVRADQLRSIVSVCTKIPSARNQQVLRFRLVLADEAPGVLAHVRMGGALPELHLPLGGHGTQRLHRRLFDGARRPLGRHRSGHRRAEHVAPGRRDRTQRGSVSGAFDRDAIRKRLRLPCEPLLILAVGKSAERIERVEIGAGGDRRYYRSEGVHYVPKIRAEELIIDSDSAETGDKS